MTTEPADLGRIHWSTALPFTRLFGTFGQAASLWPLLLGTAAVLSIYVAGRVLDALWLSAGGGVRVTVLSDGEGPTGRWTELDQFAASNSADYESWLREVARAQKADLERVSAWQPEQRKTEVNDLLQFVSRRLDDALRAVRDNAELPASERRDRRRSLERAADAVRMVASGRLPREDAGRALATLYAAPTPPGADALRDDRARFEGLVDSLTDLARVSAERPYGPFAALLRYQMGCFASAVQGVCSGRFGFGDASRDPALLGSVVSAARGVVWFGSERPLLAVLLGVVLLCASAYFGGAIARIAAVNSARNESPPLGSVLSYACEKFGANVAAPLLPLGIFVGSALAMSIASVLGAVPGLDVLVGLFYGLALLGGVAMVFTFVGLAFGFPLMQPTIAVEGSDAFDAVQRALGYVYQRAWSVGFYAVLLLAYGGVCFVAVRLLSMLLLKLTHTFTNWGMSLFGWLDSARTSTFGRLEAAWSMPAWQDLPLLPQVDGPAFWGTFGAAPTGLTETAMMWLVAAWVFLVVGLVGGFVVSFFYCGATQMYLLLRREVDAVDYDEIYWEDSDDPESELTGPDAAESGSVPAEKPAST